MKYKVLVRLFIVFLLVMLTVTMTSGRIRNFTSPTVATMPFREEIPNTAFIDGSNRVYILIDETSVFGKKQYISSIELHKVKVNDVTTVVDYVYNTNARLVIASDRPLIENITVKASNTYDRILIKSKHRDVIAIQTSMEYDAIKIIENIKKTSSLISDIWYQNGTSNHPYTTIYVKSNRGCSQILENQLNTLFNNIKSASIINIELRYLKLEFVLWMYFAIIIIMLLKLSLSNLKKCYEKLKRSFQRDKSIYYIKEIIERNYKYIILTVISAVAVCFLYVIFIMFLPLPPIHAKLIPEKLIYIGRLLNGISESNIMLDKQEIAGIDLLNHLDLTYRMLWIGLAVLIVLAIIVFVMLKVRKGRIEKGNIDNE